MGCGGCGGGHDPYAAYRRKGVRLGRGTTVGVTKSAARLEREKAGLPRAKRAPGKLAEQVKLAAEQNRELSSEIPPSGVIKSKARLAREASKK